MRLAADSSALAKRYVHEFGSEQLTAALGEASKLAVSVILVPEVISGLNRRVREGHLSGTHYERLKRHLLTDIHDAVVLQITPAVVSLSVRLLESNSLRAMDAIHVACAMEWRADLFVTADIKQFRAAKKAGLFSTLLGETKTFSPS